jgi:hypothetical protein
LHHVLAAREAEIAGLKEVVLGLEQELAARRTEIRELNRWRFWRRG